MAVRTQTISGRRIDMCAQGTSGRRHEWEKRGMTVAGEFSDSETSSPYNFVECFDVIVRIPCLQRVCACVGLSVCLCLRMCV